MKTCFKLFLLLFLHVSFINSSEAAFVNYTDINGKVHYINTDYSKIPDQYLNQVEEQLQKIEAAKTKSSQINILDPNKQPPSTTNGEELINQDKKTNPLVEVFFKTDCKDCTRLQVLLEANNIKFSLYDVENSNYGIEFYKTQQNGQLPITRIDSKIIYGNDINAVKNALNPQEDVGQNPVAASPAVKPTENIPSNPTVSNSYGGYKPGQYFKIKPLMGNKR